MLWHADPVVAYQVARSEQEEKILAHVRRSEANKAERQQRRNRPGPLASLLGSVGDLLVDAGERLQRRAGNAVGRGKLSYQ